MDLLKEYRTLRATFVASLQSTIRYYSLGGYLLTALLNPLFLIASSWVVVHIVSPSGGPPDLFARTPYGDYLTFVILGFAFNGLMVASLDRGGGALYEEQVQGTFELLALTPFNRFTWMFSKTLAAMFNSLLDLGLVILLGGLVFGFRIHLTPWALAWALVGVLFTILALQGFGYLMAAIGILWKQPQQLAVILSPLFILVTGMMFPVEVLPAPLQAVSRAIPLTHGLAVVRKALMLNQGFAALAPDLGWLLASGLAYMAVGHGTFLVLERRAREVGALGTY